MSAASDMSQTERQIFILMLLSENRRGYSADEIHTRLLNWGAAVDIRTVRRDIDSLSEICFITEEVRSGITYFSADKFKLENLTFDSGDLVSLTFLLELLRPYEQSDMGRNAQALLHRIIDHTGNLNREFVHYFREYVSLNTAAARSAITRTAALRQTTRPSDADAARYERILRQAITDHLKVRMTYQAFGQDITTERVFHPYEFVLQEGNLNVSGYCELRGSIRDFRLSRIQQLELLSEHFTRDADYQPASSGNRFLHLSGGEKEDIRLRFHGEAARYLQEYDASLADRLEADPDDPGALLFSRSAAITNDLVRWVLGYGAGVQVLAPESLKKEIQGHLAAAQDLYH